jgi:hypothetical protein
MIIVGTLNWEDRRKSAFDHNILLKGGEDMGRVFSNLELGCIS